MKNFKYFFAILFICLSLNNNFVQAEETYSDKYPDYSYEYVGNDKFENINRKIFLFNSKLNKYAIKPLHTVWSSVMPKYMITRISGISTNIEYPKRLVSSIIQKDFKSAGHETVRFLANSTIGLGGMFDPAKRFLHLDSPDDGIEQALASKNIKQGSYLVMPVMASTTPRGIIGKIFDTALNPTTYLATPAMALVKLGFTVNKTSYMQPICKMIESTFADPYEIAKKLYGIENYIKNHHLNKKEFLDTQIQLANILNPDKGNTKQLIDTKQPTEKNVVNINQDKSLDNKTDDEAILKTPTLKPDIVLKDFKPQDPITDSMRTALFELPEINDSIWNEMSVWNRCFSKKIKTSSVNIDNTKPNYNFRYILQKDKNTPLAIIYPSIGEGINAHHSIVLAKFFYDKGYSVIIQGSNFQWEFAKSMPDTYKPGILPNDADYLSLVTSKIIDSLQNKYNCEFKNKVVIGTSYGAIATLFLADKEFKHNTLGDTKFIAINPPVEMFYAMKQMDKNAEDWKNNNSKDELKEQVAETAAKVIGITQLKSEDKNFKIDRLPFSEYESKLITGFVMHQKLSDLIFVLENIPKNKSSDFYKTVNNMDYNDYANKYLLNNDKSNLDKIKYMSSLYSISDYLEKANNYKIYHSLDDYLVTNKNLYDLKTMAKDKLILFNHGGHLGFLYRPEFIEELNKDLSNSESVATK